MAFALLRSSSEISVRPAIAFCDESRHIARLVGVRDAVDAEEPAVIVGVCEGRTGLHVWGSGRVLASEEPKIP